MIHFAYPNAKLLESDSNRKEYIVFDVIFIGCGRYIASEYKPDRYKFPSTIYGKQKVEAAAQILAYESFETEKIIYEKREQRYFGESKNLAYLLTLISRSRKVRLKIGSDIWCTGSIEVTDGNPSLKSVFPNIFDAKLGKGFLSEENQDRLFILPEANFLSSHQELCDKNNVNVFSLKQFRERYAEYDFKIKTVLKVRSNELYALTSLVFEMGPNPYKGLEYFDEKDANRFFGRDDVIQEIFNIYQNLCNTSMRFMAILGPSGSGKSSIARAGLIPQIRENKKDTSVIIFRPGDHPLLSLAEELANIISKNQFTEKILKRLKQTDKKGEYNGLSAVADKLSEIVSYSFVIIIDQFEEIYSMCEDRDERTRFIRNLLYAASDKHKHISVIIIFRLDFFGTTQSHSDFNRAIAQKKIIVPAMSPNNLRSAITEPARRAGYLFDK